MALRKVVTRGGGGLARIVDYLYPRCDGELVVRFRPPARGVWSDWVGRISGPATLGLEAQSSGVSAAIRGVGLIVCLSSVRKG